MTAERSTVSAERPIWYNDQQVDETDLNAEQTANQTIQASIISNHIGDGILPQNLVANIIFDSSLAIGYLDGLAISAQNQPTDTNFGNQLSISLTGSTASGLRSVKVCIIGFDFQDNLQYETFYFFTNETQVSSFHYTQVLLLLFNDLVGNPEVSFNLGGDLIISEANPMTLSRDPIMVAQDQYPNLFFRDFFLDPSLGNISLLTFLQTALPLYNIADLNINTEPLALLPILVNDVTTQIGQKFQASSNNIQKITLLLAVQNTVSGQQNNLLWNGDIIVSIYPLEDSVACETDLAPSTPIQFPPSNIPIAQISYNYTSLQGAGIVLNSVPQPVDFVFSNSPIATGNVLVSGNYYAATIKRSGSANQCNILVAIGNDILGDNSYITTFSGNLWVDIPTENLWFRIWQDAAKVSDGQAYDDGNGVAIPKTTQDSTTLATINNVFGNLPFTGNTIYQAVLQAITQDNTPVPDQITGNPVDSRQEYVPQVSLMSAVEVSSLEITSDPLILGNIMDGNIKFFTTGAPPITSVLYSATMAQDQLLIRIVDDPTDVVRFNTAVSGLATNLLNGNLVDALIIPDQTGAPATSYRIAEAELCSMIVGDVDGDGIITLNDLNLLNTFLGYNLNVGLPAVSVITTNYTTTTVSNGYQALTQPFANLFDIAFQLVDPNTGSVVADGYDGVLVADPTNPAQAQFTSASITFNNIVGLLTYQLVILSNGANGADYGGWTIVSLDSTLDVITLQKIYLTGTTLGQMLRADINGDFIITAADGYLLESYLQRYPDPTIPAPSYPAPTSDPFTKIGTRFNIIQLRLEEFVDRHDDYAADPDTRAISVHPVQNIFASDGYLAQHNFYYQPITMSITQQLVWDPSLIVTSTLPRLVPAIYNQINGFTENFCVVDGIQCNTYPIPQAFDPGRVDFFVPNNLIIGNGGQLWQPDGDFYKVDFECGIVVLEIPDGLFSSEKTIDIMTDFVIDYTRNGATRLGFPSMRFADCSFVSAEALANNQIQFSVSVQSFSPNTNGLTSDGYSGVIVDGKMGIAFSPTTGLLTINFTNLYQDAILQTLSTKIQVQVFLKKGGFNNQPLFVDSATVQNMLSLISTFSGANVGGVSALVDLGNDVNNILPILHGGLGLSSVGATGTVLVSNGAGVSYQFLTAQSISYTPLVSANWSGTAPTTVQTALDRMASLLVSLNSGPIP